MRERKTGATRSKNERFLFTSGGKAALWTAHPLSKFQKDHVPHLMNNTPSIVPALAAFCKVFPERRTAHPCPGSYGFGSSGAWLPRNRKGRAIKDGSHGGKHGTTLFAHRGKITANGTKSRRSLFTAKRAGNLLLAFDHPEISFGLIVRKRHRKII